MSLNCMWNINVRELTQDNKGRSVLEHVWVRGRNDFKRSMDLTLVWLMLKCS